MKKEDIIENFRRAKSKKRRWVKEAEEDFEFAVGKQWDKADLHKLEKRGIRGLTINKIQPNLFLISGIQRQNRADYRAFPEGEEDTVKAEVATVLLKNSLKQSMGEYKLSEIFEDGLICGEGWLQPYVDYTYDLINGDLKLKKQNPLNIFVDPNCNEYDLSDAEYGIKSDAVTDTVSDSILYSITGDALFDAGTDFTSDYNSFYGNGVDYYNVTDGDHDLCAANSNAIDPIDGIPGCGKTSLKYLIQIEDNSDLSGAASDSGDIGATMLKQYGKSETLWGTTGYNLLQDGTSGQADVDLWPFPNEDIIKEKMAAYSYDSGSLTGARGFCADTANPRTDTGKITLTSYIWEYLGNEIPDSIYGKGKCTVGGIGRN